MGFRWNEWNLEHIAEHAVVRMAVRPYPRRIEDDKWLVRGQRPGGRFLQVIFVLDQDETVYVIHARPLADQEKRRFRRRRK